MRPAETEMLFKLCVIKLLFCGWFYCCFNVNILSHPKFLTVYRLCVNIADKLINKINKFVLSPAFGDGAKGKYNE